MSDAATFAPPRLDDFLEEMREEHRADLAADQDNRTKAASDLKFLAGEQWEPDVLQMREGRPSLTLNRMPQFVRQVTGDIRINKPAIKVTPSETGDIATAEVIEGLVRHIEHTSKAGRIYATVADAQVGCGMGHMRLCVEYPEDSFDPELVVKRIRNPFAVVWDMAAEKPDRTDAGHCFVESSMARKAFTRAFPKADVASWVGSIPKGLSDWITTDNVRVVEYWKVVKRPVTLYQLANGAVIDDSEEDSFRRAAEQVGILRERKTHRSVVVQYLSNGKELLGEPYIWPGRRIPIVTAWGEEVVLGDKTVRHGLIRFARDPQYLANYFMSAALEVLGQQPKGKWITSDKAIEGYEQDWANANTSTEANLVYKANQTPPTFQAPPAFPAAFVQMAQIAEDAMKGTTGIYDAALGQRSNETSGAAITARDRQGDVSTFVYPDNLVAAIENLASQIVEVIPHVYNTPDRQIRILGEDLASQVQKVNQTAPGVDPKTGRPNQKIDLTTGRYDVVVQTGPGFTTRRQEAAEAMMEFARIFPAAAPLLMDLVAKNQDWPNRDEFLERVQALLPKPNQGPPPPPPPNPKDLAGAEKAHAETQGIRLDNIGKANALGINPADLQDAPQEPQEGPLMGESPAMPPQMPQGPVGEPEQPPPPFAGDPMAAPI